MNDLTNLSAAIVALGAKVDANNTKPAAVPAVDIQPAIDALTTQVNDIAAKIPA